MNYTILIEQTAATFALRPGWIFRAAFSSLCVILLAAALSATSLCLVLPIFSTLRPPTSLYMCDLVADYLPIPYNNRDPGLRSQNILPLRWLLEARRGLLHATIEDIARTVFL